MTDKELSFRLLTESRKRMDVSGCRSVEEVLAKTFFPADNRISDEELDLIAAAGGEQGKKLSMCVITKHKE